MSECTRCHNERETLPIYNVMAHTWLVPSNSDFYPATLPSIERACGDCLTDREIMLELSPAIEFVLESLTKSIDIKDKAMLISLETVRAFFMVRNNDSDGTRTRKAAVRALGLTVNHEAEATLA